MTLDELDMNLLPESELWDTLTKSDIYTITVQIESENAKLRELAAELWALADGYTPDDSELDTARDLMRELGMEV